MNFKIGDKFKEIHNGTIIWTVTDENAISLRLQLEGKNAFGLTFTKWIDYTDLFTNYAKIEDEQTDWFGNWDKELPKGIEKKQTECRHNWKIYHGLNFSDEYCDNCGLKREIVRT